VENGVMTGLLPGANSIEDDRTIEAEKNV